MRPKKPILFGLLLLGLALLSSCHMPRKAEVRRCGKADRLLARAVWLCPDMLVRDSGTAVVGGSTVEVSLDPSAQVDVDSILDACDKLRQALQAELARQADAPHTTDAAPGTPASKPKAVLQAVKVLQHQSCQWESFTDTVNGTVITVTNREGRPLLFVEQLPRKMKVPCPPVVQRAPCPPAGVAPWYRTFFFVVMGLATLSFALHLSRSPYR